MQQNFNIYINDKLYKQVVLETDDNGNYNLISVLNMIHADHAAGLLDSFIPPEGTLSIKIERA